MHVAADARGRVRRDARRTDRDRPSTPGPDAVSARPSGAETTLTAVALCVVTKGRPVGLARCLDGIGRLEVPGGVELRVVVVDNDERRSAEPVVALAAAELPWPVAYRAEPRPGIPQARNTAVDAAGPVTLVGFMDDDEVPRPDWLASMLRVWETTDADVVMAPSEPVFDQPPPGWVVEGRFFERTRFPTGTPISYHYARTSGVLIRRAALEGQPGPFDELFRYSGGSDLHLFARMADAGCRIVWDDDAVVDEHVPTTRANARWLVRRAYRIGNTRSLILLADGAGAARRVRRVAGSLVRLPVRVARALPGLRHGRRGAVRLAQVVATELGSIVGAVGHRYEEYRTIHGD
jgi:GT2 family glycosyltransferase